MPQNPEISPQPENYGLNEIDHYNNCSLSESMDRFEAMVEFTEEGGTFLQFFTACPEEKFAQTVDYITGRLKINPENVFRIGLQKEYSHVKLIDNLINLRDRVEATAGNTVIIIVDNFENLAEHAVKAGEYAVSRVAHDYGQDIADNKRIEKTYENSNKKLVILTHLGLSLGQEVYDKAMQSVATSQYIHGVIEIK